MKVAAQVNSFRQKRAHLADDRLNGPGTDAVLAIRYSIFQNVNRLLKAGKMLHRSLQSFGINLAVRNLNAGIALRLVRWNRDLQKQCLGTSQLKAYAQPAVIIDADKVAGVLYFRQTATKFVEWKRRSPAADAFGKIVIESPINQPAEPAIQGRFRSARLEHHVMLRPSHVRICLQRMNGSICRRMGQAEIACDLRRLNESSFFPWRKFPQKISQGNINVRLIESGPVTAKIAQSSDHALREALKQRDRLGCGKGAFIFKPLWIRKMVQRDKRADAALVQRPQHLPVPCQGSFIPLAFFGFNAAPFHGEPERVHAQGLCQVKIFFGAAPPVT